MALPLNLSFNSTSTTTVPILIRIAAGHAHSHKPVTLWRRLGGNGKGTVAARGGGGGGGGSTSGKYKGTQMREKQLTEMIEKKVMEAKEVCGQDERSDECKVAWDEVEEVSQAKADLRLKLEIMHQDPLESFCLDNPETDECRLYED